MLPDRVSNPGPLTYESGALPMPGHSTSREIYDILLQDCFSEHIILMDVGCFELNSPLRQYFSL